MTVITASTIWIFEFKMKGDAPSKSPLKQIQSRGYTEKYQSKRQNIREIGVVFDPEERNITHWEEKRI